MNAESHGVVPIHGWMKRFTPVPPSVHRTRHAAQAALCRWGGCPSPSQAALLGLPELATDALRHGRVPGRYYEVRIAYDAEKLVGVEVSDPGEGLPVIGDAAPDAERGRGLAIVDALAEASVVRERIAGTAVWARLRL